MTFQPTDGLLWTSTTCHQ